MMKVENLMGRSGKVANQFRIWDTENNVQTFQSYDSPIVTVDYDKREMTVYPDWDYSTTTGKYRNQFMDFMGFFEMATKKGFLAALKAGKAEDNLGRTFKVVLA